MRSRGAASTHAVSFRMAPGAVTTHAPDNYKLTAAPNDVR